MIKFWDEMTEEEQYQDYLSECQSLRVPAMSFEEWKKN